MDLYKELSDIRDLINELDDKSWEIREYVEDPYEKSRELDKMANMALALYDDCRRLSWAYDDELKRDKKSKEDNDA